eukprot:TRINITY_DN121260_c0_g1_i1.p1 TRINITY_DN121260_c0_g1~~TRINITY_DN121260_c0_g1_i1.p1  ORF type:complete len:513 (-),score=108.74 TRINITY_DN121260_c0_g1_i1:741-2279(-)
MESSRSSSQQCCWPCAKSLAKCLEFTQQVKQRSFQRFQRLHTTKGPLENGLEARRPLRSILVKRDVVPPVRSGAPLPLRAGSRREWWAKGGRPPPPPASPSGRAQGRERRKKHTRSAKPAPDVTEEERQAFAAKAKQEKEAVEARLKTAYHTGAPVVALNCSFGGDMDYRELTSLAKQLQLCYSAVKAGASLAQLHITSMDNRNPAWDALHKIGSKKWRVHFHDTPAWYTFPREKLVYLSPDADEDLDEVCKDAVYVVGGLVDRAVCRDRSLQQAQEHQAQCVRRLPIKSCGPPGMHPVLNIDVVVAILSERHRLGPQSDWREIFAKCIPKRHQPGPTRGMLRKERAAARAAGQGSPDQASQLQKVDAETGESPAGATSEAARTPPSGASAGSHDEMPETSSRGRTRSSPATSCGDAAAMAAAGCTSAVVCLQQQPVRRTARQRALRQGDRVNVVGYGEAEIESAGLLSRGRFKGKYQVRYLDDGRTFHVSPQQVSDPQTTSSIVIEGAPSG